MSLTVTNQKAIIPQWGDCFLIEKQSIIEIKSLLMNTIYTMQKNSKIQKYARIN